MTIKKFFKPADVIDARSQIINLSHDQLLARGYINIQAVLADVSTFDVVLEGHNGKPIQTIKAVRGLTGMSLAEAKHVVDNAPSVVIANADADKATEALHALRSEGASASVRRIGR